jgi:hypothetical protein
MGRGATAKTYHEKKPLKKTFTMLWNTLNEGNYTKISHRLRFIVNDENYKVAIRELIEMSILHSIYRRYFLHLLMDIIQIQGDKAKEYVKEYVTTFQESYWVLQTPKDCTMPAYELFCKQQKHKVKMLHTIEFLIDVSLLNIIDIDLLWIWNTLLHAYHDIPHCDTYYIDLVLNSMMTLLQCIQCMRHTHKKYDIKMKQQLHDSMSSYVENMKTKNTSIFLSNMKLIFLCEKISDILKLVDS